MAKSKKHQVRLPFDAEDLGLTPQELKFLALYCNNGFDAIEAYKVCWPVQARAMSSAELRVEALTVANQRHIKIGVQRFIASVVDPQRDIFEAELLTVLKTRAMYDPMDYINEEGEAKDLNEIERTKRYAIDDYDVSFYGRSAEKKVKRVKLANRPQAIKQLQELLDRGKEEEIQVVDTDMKNKLSQIFHGHRNGIKTAKELNSSENLALPEETESVIIDPVDVDSIIEEKEVEMSEIVRGAKNMARKLTSGVVVDEHPIVEDARETARQRIQGILRSGK